MKTPDFFNQIPTIKFHDPLAEFLGAFEDGIVEYSYLDAVKLAGHSCPTVAGAYLLTYKALELLYPDSTPLRGGIKVEMCDKITDGVTGVIANVISLITGATDKSGFKGIAGNYVRHGLLEYGVELEGLVRFTRVDNGSVVELDYSPLVAPHPLQQILMQKIFQGNASEDEKKDFRLMWQERVRSLLIDQFDHPEMIVSL